MACCDFNILRIECAGESSGGQRMLFAPWNLEFPVALPQLSQALGLALESQYCGFSKHWLSLWIYLDIAGTSLHKMLCPHKICLLNTPESWG